MQRSETSRVATLCGSPRDESRIVVWDALDAASNVGAETELLDVRAYRLPGGQSSTEGLTVPDRLRRHVEESDTVPPDTQNYHSSYSGTPRTELDYCGRDQLGATTVGLLEAAAGAWLGSPPVPLRTVSRTLHGRTLPPEVAIPDSHSLVTDSGLTDDRPQQRVCRLGRELTEHANAAQDSGLGETAASTTGRGEVHG